MSCGGGEETRTRRCDNPRPSDGGLQCTVDGSKDKESRRCNENQCSGRYKIFMSNCLL